MGRGKVVHQVAAQTVTTYIVKSGLDGRAGIAELGGCALLI